MPGQNSDVRSRACEANGDMPKKKTGFRMRGAAPETQFPNIHTNVFWCLNRRIILAVEVKTCSIAR